jgi:hypothetical protein
LLLLLASNPLLLGWELLGTLERTLARYPGHMPLG